MEGQDLTAVLKVIVVESIFNSAIIGSSLNKDTLIEVMLGRLNTSIRYQLQITNAFYSVSLVSKTI